MLTLEDCIKMSELTEEEIAAIAEHERLPVLAATELGNYLLHCPDGPRRITIMIVDSIAMAQDRDDTAHATKLQRVLHQFRQKHACAVENSTGDRVTGI